MAQSGIRLWCRGRLSFSQSPLPSQAYTLYAEEKPCEKRNIPESLVVILISLHTWPQLSEQASLWFLNFSPCWDFPACSRIIKRSQILRGKSWKSFSAQGGITSEGLFTLAPGCWATNTDPAHAETIITSSSPECSLNTSQPHKWGEMKSIKQWEHLQK